MTCLNETSSVEFSCVLEIVRDVRAGKINATMVRKILKQADAALSQLAPDEAAVLSAMTTNEQSAEDICDILEAQATEPSVQMSPLLATLLINLAVKLATRWLSNR